MIFKFFSALIFPPRCIGCEAWGQTLCHNCRAQLNFLKTPAHLPYLKKKYFGEAYSALAYEGKVHDWVHQYKYRRRWEVGRELAALLLKTPLDWKNVDALVPVPLHWRRLLRRGFNPSHFLAQALGKKVGKPVRHLLQRKKATPQQTKLSREARLQNVAGAFKIFRKTFSQQRLLLIDDVLTTGATVNECARILTGAGAAHVDVLTLARAL